MSKTVSNQAETNGTAALSLMEKALALLDGADFPGEVGADLDHAICRLREILGIPVMDGPDGGADPVGEAGHQVPRDPLAG